MSSSVVRRKRRYDKTSLEENPIGKRSPGTGESLKIHVKLDEGHRGRRWKTEETEAACWVGEGISPGK